MPSAKIFLVGENESQLSEMVETAFDKEDILQVLLERYPDLLPGDQINPDKPRRWLLVSREMGVPGQEKGSNIWSLDHLFLDQEGIPTFVECKRSTDTRSRREVVAQMLDYAANGIQYWSIEALRQAAMETALRRKRILDEELQALIGPEGPTDLEDFWKSAEQNLRSGRIRLIFVTDNVPRELRRLVEFLNEKMNDVEVLAVELKQFIGQGKHKAIVPRLIGMTETALDTKIGIRSKPLQNRETFIEKCDPEAVKVFYNYMINCGETPGYSISWGVLGFSLGYITPEDNKRIPLFFCYPPDKFEFSVDYLVRKSADEKVVRKEVNAFGILKDAGKKTLRADITPENAARMKEIVDFILKKTPEWVATSSG
jgi:hypothetical protein